MTTYHYHGWRWAFIPQIVNVQVITGMALRPVAMIDVVRTMVSNSVTCDWLIPIQMGRVVVIAC